MPAMPALPDLPASVEIVLRLVVIALAALIGFVAVRTAVGVSVRHMVERRQEEAGAGGLPEPELERRVQTVGRLAVRIAGVAIVVIATLMALDLFGIEIGPAIAGLGVVGLAVGFGAQALIRDYLAGIFIVLENQYSAGDVIRIAGVEGTVEDFSLRRTTLRDLDGTVHTVPNGQIIVASNMTRLWARVNLDVDVSPDGDLDEAAEVIDRVGADLHADPAWAPRLLEAPKVVRVDALAGPSVKLKVLGKVRAGEQWAVGSELRKRILAASTGDGIRFSTPESVDTASGKPRAG
jgi:moderate conductance mechanosensitive channel